MKKHFPLFIRLWVSASIGWAFLLPVHAGAESSAPAPEEPIVSPAVTPTLSPAVRDLPTYEPVAGPARDINPHLTYPRNPDPALRIPGGLDPLLARQAAAPPAAPSGFLTPILNFDGQGYTGVNPPDTNGDAGPNHFIQVINGSGGGIARVYNKSGGTLATFGIDSLGAGVCASGLGDGIVLYDPLADRWFLAEFSGSGNNLCLYVSTSPDPLGTWNGYIFSTPNFPDYPKFAVWPDAYYATTNENSPAVYAFDRARMLAGLPATSIRFTAPSLSGFPFQALTPGDLDGSTPPPAGAPGYLMRHRDTEVHGPAGLPSQDILETWAFHVDWATPSNSTFTKLADILTAEFDSDLCGLSSFSCIRQPSGPQLDPLREVIMWRLQYRNFGSYEALVGNFVTDVTGSDQGGVRWFELRKAGAGAWGLQQEGTFAPDTHSRWMGAISMDGSGNLAVGYNISSTTMFPGLRYAGRLASDPPGTLPQSEGLMVNGTASNSSNRYGDYSSMSVDPADECTFWFTGEYNAASTWSTRITTFRFDTCTGALGPDFSVQATPPTLDVCAPAEGAFDIEVGSVEGFAGPVTLSATGAPGGTTVDFSVNPIIPADPPNTSTLTIGNTGGATAGSYPLDIVGTSTTRTHTATVTLNLFSAIPGAPSLTSPANGATGVAVAPTFEWSASAGVTAYLLEVATEAGFTNVVYSTVEPTTSHTIPEGSELDYSTRYYWRVTATNACGSGSHSATFSFTTADFPASFCSSPNLAIPDSNPTGVSNSFSIPASGNLLDVDISLDVTHTWVGDLMFTVSHGGTSVTIFDRPGVPGSTFGCSGDDIAATLDDEAATPVESECAATTPTISGAFIPNNPLTAFDGIDLTGDWTITASDLAGGDTGTLNEWCVIPTYEVPPSYGVDLTPFAALFGDPGATVTYTLSITNTGNVTDTFTLLHGGETWPTSLSAPEITLGAGQSGSFIAWVSIPALAYGLDMDTATITATSQAEPLEMAVASLETTAAASYGVELPGDQAGEGVVGTVVTYTLTVTNQGNTTDTFTLAFSGTWTAEVDSSPAGPLGPGESQAFTVTVHVPAEANAGEMEITTVTAQSAGDAAATASTHLETTAAPVIRYLYLPAVVR